LFFSLASFLALRPPLSFPSRRSSDLFPPGVLLPFPSSLPSAVQFQCLNDCVLHLLWRGSRREIFVNPLFRDFKLLHLIRLFLGQDRKSTRLNSSHVSISYAVFCLKKK